MGHEPIDEMISNSHSKPSGRVDLTVPARLTLESARVV
jgi:hypothetical protein